MTNFKQIINEENAKLKKQLHTGSLTNDQIDWLNLVVNGDWEYENSVVNVYGNVNFSGHTYTSIPVQFGKVDGTFNCAGNKLTSLKGCPSEICENFICHKNQLTSLEYAPKIVGVFIRCELNPFILNDKLFEDIKQYNRNNITTYFDLLDELKAQIPIQFGITDKKVIDKIWQSYMNILEGKSE